MGNAGTIWTFIVKANDKEKLSPGDFFRTVSALCLYCHESVNRMKLRDAGGLRLFVQILEDPQKDKNLKEKIIKSLMQFAYDDRSLKVLQCVGLVPALVNIIDEFNQKNCSIHSCEQFICDINADDNDDDHDDKQKPELKMSEKAIHQQELTHQSVAHQEEIADDPEFKPDEEQPTSEEATKNDSAEGSGNAVITPRFFFSLMCHFLSFFTIFCLNNSQILAMKNEPIEESENMPAKKQEKQYRINSPSYR